jgi:hypothetical protein
MDCRTRRTGLVAVLLGLVLAGCGQGSTPAEQADIDTATPEGLAAALVTPADLGANWSVTQMPDFPELSDTGIVSDEAQRMLPRMEPCDKAGDEEQAVADDLEWDAFRQLDLHTGTPTGSPSPGTPPVHHLVFAQEFLGSGTVDETEATYDALVSGGDACLGTEKTPDGETVRTTGLTVPDLGDASHGWRSVVTEPGPAGRTATWDLRQVLVRDGGVLLMAQVAEITTPGVDTVVDDAEVGSILGTMVDKLP